MAVQPESDSLPWYLRCMILAATLANISAHWNIAWHRSIGKSTFWAPPHILTWLCGMLAALACGYLIIVTTFRNDCFPKSATVRIWGLRGPLGAFIATWGLAAMLTSVPFDLWWHTAYGLEENLLSPPHTVLIAGLLALQIGTLALLSGYRNRAENAGKTSWTGAYLYTGSMVLILSTAAITEFTLRPYMHSASMYRAVCIVTPAIVVGLARATSRHWAATIAASGYSGFCLLMLWIIPLFPATPSIGPIYTNISKMVPLEFPLLLILPAIAIDILFWKWKDLNRILLCLITGPVFFWTFVFGQWEFADFLQSPQARNWIFGANYFDFGTRPESIYATYQFVSQGSFDPELKLGMALALACTIVSCWVGLAWGDWMKRIRR